MLEQLDIPLELEEEDRKLVRLTREQRESAQTMDRRVARYIVDAYYQAQRHRIRANQQLLAESRSEAIVDRLFADAKGMENLYKSVLKSFAEAHAVGRWSLSIMGIGPVLASGLLAYIDIQRAPNVSKIWRLAGLDPTMPKAQKGELRSYNSHLKTLCYLIGESFVKVSRRPNDVYGKLYLERKAYEMAHNEAGDYAKTAAGRVETVGKTTEARKYYEAGLLSPGHIHARARRYATKRFLSHWHQVAYEVEHGEPPPPPYILTVEPHSQFDPPPNWPMD